MTKLVRPGVVADLIVLGPVPYPSDPERSLSLPTPRVGVYPFRDPSRVDLAALGNLCREIADGASLASTYDLADPGDLPRLGTEPSLVTPRARAAYDALWADGVATVSHHLYRRHATIVGATFEVQALNAAEAARQPRARDLDDEAFPAVAASMRVDAAAALAGYLQTIAGQVGRSSSRRQAFSQSLAPHQELIREVRGRAVPNSEAYRCLSTALVAPLDLVEFPTAIPPTVARQVFPNTVAGRIRVARQDRRLRRGR